MAKEDYFRNAGAVGSRLRALLDRESALRAARFGLERRSFLGGALGALAASSILQQLPRLRASARAEDAFQPPSDDCYAELAAAHATFTQRDRATELDWELIQQAASAQQAAVPETILNVLRTLGTLYSGFGVSQLVHMTQTATRAVRSNASDELVLIALIHDIGEIQSPLNHTEIAGALARPYVSDAGYRILLHHTEFQLKHYGDATFNPTDLRDRYQSEPWYGDAAVFSDAWDQLAFDPDYKTMPLEEFEPLVRTIFGRTPEQKQRTAEDCLALQPA